MFIYITFFICNYFLYLGLVPDEAVPDSDPEWGLNVVFTKSANITYGPWVDKQRYMY